ncbi:MAG: hypothetical protein EHM35_21010, partial [Planctomycetaceae bacterium]
GLGEDRFEAHDQIEDGQYTSYAVGLNLEYPLGNRSRQAEWLRRQWERRKATSILHNTADQVAVQVRERARRVQTSFDELKVQQEAVQAARAHLQTLEESEAIREKLTPEFLLVKLQAQDTYAQAQRGEIGAIVELNIALAELAQAAGTILDLRMVEASLSSVLQSLPDPEPPQENSEQRRISEPPWEMSPSF